MCEGKNSSRDRESDLYSIMMDVAMYDKDNPIMDWLCNTRNELGMDEEDVDLLKRKLDFGSSSGKKKGNVRLKEDDEDSAEDFESDSPQDDDNDVDKEDCARSSATEASVGKAYLTSDESTTYVTFKFKYVPMRLN
ncbi:hypothetical protein ABZP36_030211 [Zizania latifolia]